MQSSQMPILTAGTVLFGACFAAIVLFSTPESGSIVVVSFYVSLMGFLIGLFSLGEIWFKRRFEKNRFTVRKETFSYGAIIATFLVMVLVIKKLF